MGPDSAQAVSLGPFQIRTLARALGAVGWISPPALHHGLENSHNSVGFWGLVSLPEAAVAPLVLTLERPCVYPGSSRGCRGSSFRGIPPPLSRASAALTGTSRAQLPRRAAVLPAEGAQG